MLERYYKNPCTAHRLRSGPAGPFLDGFAESMCTGGYSSETSASYLYAVYAELRITGTSVRAESGRRPARPRRRADRNPRDGLAAGRWN
jgi:hypothetical protein